MTTYNQFLKNKTLVDIPSGFKVNKLNNNLFNFQTDITKWALRRGRAALFEDCGLGKTFQQLEWAHKVHKKTKGPVIILAPLAVSEQTIEEGNKFGIDVNLCNDQSDVINGINITNYERLHKFDLKSFEGVVLDESSILKNFEGKIRNQIINGFSKTPYRLACTATPSPNDYMELGNHAEFLGVMGHREMLAMFFVNDSGNTGKWRLKGHAQEKRFWEWLCSWAIMIDNPCNLGYESDGFELPPLNYHEHILPYTGKRKRLFVELAGGLTDRRRIRKETIEKRCEYAAKLINKTDKSCVIWCGLNEESKLLASLIDDAVEITGSQDNEYKSSKMLDFAHGKIKRIVTKPKIAGFGMNWQICNQMVFVGLNDSWESLYQAIRRLWRFGQINPVDVHIVIEEREGSVLANIKRKDDQAKKMMNVMSKYTNEITKQMLSQKRNTTEYNPKLKMEIPKWV